MVEGAHTHWSKIELHGACVPHTELVTMQLRGAAQCGVDWQVSNVTALRLRWRMGSQRAAEDSRRRMSSVIIRGRQGVSVAGRGSALWC